MLTTRLLIRASVLSACLLVIPALASADPAKSSTDTPFASAVTATFIPNPPPDPNRAISGGFSLVHDFGDAFPGFYVTYAQRVTQGDHAVAIVAQMSFHSRFGEHMFSVMGGAEVAVFHNDNFCFSGRGIAGFTHFSDEGSDFSMQFTGVVRYHLKQGFSIEGEVGVYIDRASDGDLFPGFLLNVGAFKRF